MVAGQVYVADGLLAAPVVLCVHVSEHAAFLHMYSVNLSPVAESSSVAMLLNSNLCGAVRATGFTEVNTGGEFPVVKLFVDGDSGSTPMVPDMSVALAK